MQRWVCLNRDEAQVSQLHRCIHGLFILKAGTATSLIGDMSGNHYALVCYNLLKLPRRCTLPVFFFSALSHICKYFRYFE